MGPEAGRRRRQFPAWLSLAPAPETQLRQRPLSMGQPDFSDGRSPEEGRAWGLPEWPLVTGSDLRRSPGPWSLGVQLSHGEPPAFAFLNLVWKVSFPEKMEQVMRVQP